MDKEKLKQFGISCLQTMKRYRWISIIFASMFLISILGYLFIIFGGRFVFDEKAVILPTTSTVVAEDGTILGELYTENRKYVTINQIPEHVQQAFLAVEDQRFYDHAGISFPAVARAIYRDILAMQKVEGGSTITQQLAKNLFLENDKSWMRKTKEVMASIYLERNYTKSDILELYLNEIYLAHGIYGVGTAAEYFFNKPIEELTIDEGALLAAMVKAPNSYSPHHDIELAKERRNIVLQQLANVGEISTEKLLELEAKDVKVTDQPEERDPWLDDYLAYVLEEAEQKYHLSRESLKRGGYTIEVHVDPEMQRIAYQQMQDHRFFSGSNQEMDSSFVLMNQETGALKVLIADRQFQLGDTNHLLTRKQPGSIIKPIAVYAPALEQGDYQPYGLLPDQDMSYDGYQVGNPDGQFEGEVTMYDAIRTSKNAPAVWLLDQIGIGYSKSMLAKMNMTLEDNGLAIALGGLEQGVTPIQMAEAYRPFIHNGEWLESSSIRAIYNNKQEEVERDAIQTKPVFQPQVAWDMLKMLEAVVTDGTAASGDYTKALAGKTGSTQHPEVPGEVKDAWFAGITPEYVTATWIGYDQATADNYLTTGSESAVQLTKSILTEMDKLTPLTEEFEVPEDVEDLPDPIRLPTIDDVDAKIGIGGFSLLQVELTWTAAEDSRVVYRVYERNDQEDELVGEVEGEGTYTISPIPLFQTKEYYVVPYNPLSDQTGEPSNIAAL
ncbi:transglycosylase domain-containing protein [Gracilibacillus alcaliphilus]|uniref:transglycosylase domain-containing protein n=1 Tax=Gracilibacillus alcaliphilus TaxID=1401441 RepID=UPI0019597D28|nr:transglycosylase domain-containing protein [Gracilibacillus alcaliphilus]MBM7675413.1 penicillin-binding protein 2A [Gracilibacillus alcaliphilus]